MPAYMFCLEKFLNREEFLFDNVILSNFLILFLTCKSTYQMPWDENVSFKDWTETKANVEEHFIS